ncbi:unnamed protein product [Lathyrus sativus]|nr:unnamed protein product [Lathyrus sativus]
MGRGRGRGCGRPRLVAPSTSNPTTAIFEQNATKRETIVDNEVRKDTLESGILAEEEEENITDTDTLGHQSTEERKAVEASQMKKLWADIINENRNSAKGLVTPQF